VIAPIGAMRRFYTCAVVAKYNDNHADTPSALLRAQHGQRIAQLLHRRRHVFKIERRDGPFCVLLRLI